MLELLYKTIIPINLEVEIQILMKWVEKMKAKKMTHPCCLITSFKFCLSCFFFLKKKKKKKLWFGRFQQLSCFFIRSWNSNWNTILKWVEKKMKELKTRSKTHPCCLIISFKSYFSCYFRKNIKTRRLWFGRFSQHFSKSFVFLLLAQQDFLFAWIIWFFFKSSAYYLYNAMLINL